MIVDDEPQVFNAVERDLRLHYRNEYRIVKSGSGTEAMDVVQQLKQRNAALALSTAHSSIRLLDEAGPETLNLAAFGLSKAYQEKGPVDLTHNPLAKEALSGRPVIVNDVTDDARLQYTRQVLEEGIHSLVVVPIIGRSGPLGVLRVYAEQARRFSDADATWDSGCWRCSP